MATVERQTLSTKRSLTLLIGVGDTLASSKVVDVRVHEEALNNKGQIAFEAILENGTYTVFRAETVPEPGEGIVSVLALGILFMLGRHWRSGKQKIT